MIAKRTDNRRRRVSATWHDYEYAKQTWALKNPAATPEQYQAAMIRIAARLGL